MPAIVDAMLGDARARRSRGLTRSCARRSPSRRRRGRPAAWLELRDASVGRPARAARPRRAAGRDRRSRRRRRRRPPCGARARQRAAPAPTAATVAAAGRQAGAARAAARASRAGVALVTGDRRRLGPDARQADLGEHRPDPLGRARGGRHRRARRAPCAARAREHVVGLRIRSRSVDQTAGSLSGGNQQKVVFAKWLDAAAVGRSCSTTRRAASTSAPRPRCTR